jgi:uncharacterized protein (DUF1330 family)
MMPKGYWIVRLDVHDDKAYDAYRARNGAALKKYGARFLVRGGKFDKLEGESRARNVVIEFASHQAALDCYRSPEYAAAAAHRKGAAAVDLIVIEGYDGPQP